MNQPRVSKKVEELDYPHWAPLIERLTISVSHKKYRWVEKTMIPIVTRRECLVVSINTKAKIEVKVYRSNQKRCFIYWLMKMNTNIYKFWIRARALLKSVSASYSKTHKLLLKISNLKMVNTWSSDLKFLEWTGLKEVSLLFTYIVQSLSPIRLLGS